MRNSSDQRISDAADRAQAGDTAAAEVADALDSPSGEEPQDTSDAKEAFDGLTGRGITNGSPGPKHSWKLCRGRGLQSRYS